MSWDVTILSAKHVDGSDAEPPPLGDAGDVRKAVSSALPGVDWSDPAWGTLEGKGWSIEFNTEAEGTVGDMMLHVRGGGDPLPAITKLCTQNGWVALDMSTGDYIELEAPSDASWKEFQGFRDSVVSQVAGKSRGNKLVYIVALLLAMLIVLLRRLL